MNFLMALIYVCNLTALAVSAELQCPTGTDIRETEERKKCEHYLAEIKHFSDKLNKLSPQKRAGRDGYILLQRMFNKYGLLHAKNSREAQAIALELNALVKQNPEYPNIQDFRLSDEIAQSEAWRQGYIEKAKNHIPSDSRSYGFLGEGQNLVVIYQARLEFFRLPPDISFSAGERNRLVLKKTLGSGTTEEIRLASLSPIQKLAFKRRFEILPRVRGGPLQYFLLCTYAYPELGASYSPSTPEEEDLVGQASEYIPPYVNKAGLDDFCGIMTSTGKIQFSFPVVQSDPGTLLWPIGFRDRHAAVALGDKTSFDGEDGTETQPGNFREVLIWDFPDKLRRIKIEPKAAHGVQFLDDFHREKL